jgi:type IV pilus assembly protein PilE
MVSRARGFTLLELMIVVAVMAILAVIAIGQYREQVRKGNRAEAVRGISELQMQLEKYRGYCPTYADQASCRDRNGDGDAADTGEPAYPSATGSNYTFTVSGQSASGYTVTATRAGTMTSDPKCGNFVMTVANGVSTKSVSSPGTVPYCWRQ